MRHYFHQIPHHFRADALDQGRAFWRDAHHHLAPVFARTRAHDVAEIFQSRDQPARRRHRMLHLARDGGHGQHFIVIERSKEEKLRERNVAWREFLTKTQNETTLHLHDDVGKLLRIRAKSIGAIGVEWRVDGRIQRA